jgi:hypothetical protein
VFLLFSQVPVARDDWFRIFRDSIPDAEKITPIIIFAYGFRKIWSGVEGASADLAAKGRRGFGVLKRSESL